jgi:hypothetical protein
MACRSHSSSSVSGANAPAPALDAWCPLHHAIHRCPRCGRRRSNAFAARAYSRWPIRMSPSQRLALRTPRGCRSLQHGSDSPRLVPCLRIEIDQAIATSASEVVGFQLHGLRDGGFGCVPACRRSVSALCQQQQTDGTESGYRALKRLNVAAAPAASPARAAHRASVYESKPHCGDWKSTRVAAFDIAGLASSRPQLQLRQHQANAVVVARWSWRV